MVIPHEVYSRVEVSTMMMWTTPTSNWAGVIGKHPPTMEESDGEI